MNCVIVVPPPEYLNFKPGSNKDLTRFEFAGLSPLRTWTVVGISEPFPYPPKPWPERPDV